MRYWPNPRLTFIPFLLMGDGDGADDATTAMMQGHESVFLHHLRSGFTGDKTTDAVIIGSGADGATLARAAA